MRQSLSSKDLEVQFNYRQMSKYTEESWMGADGGFLVKVTTRDGTVKKASLFQAKLLDEVKPVRELRMNTEEAKKFRQQVRDMLKQSEEAVGLFYTEHQVYVVDAEHYRDQSIDDVKTPLSDEHRLVTLGTYLGRWMARCTRGDTSSDLFTRIEHLEGFKHRMAMSIISHNPTVKWVDDPAARRWRKSR